MGSKSKSTIVGFRYSFDIHGALSKAIDGMLKITSSGKTAWQGHVTSSQTIRISAPNLFGGDKGEGGIDGDFDLMMGDDAQGPNPKLVAALGGGLVPNFRGFAGFFFSGLVTSINPYPKPWEILRYRRMNGWDGAVWYPETCAIDLEGGAVRAMNPAHILYEVYTNRENGLGIDRAMLDDGAFRAAALKLYNEGFGLCVGWKRSSGTLADFREQLTDHIGAYCGPDRNTGLITLKLIRNDYNIADLPLFDEDSGLLSVEDDETSSAQSAPSQIWVEYTDAQTGETRRARAINPAMAALHGGPSVETKQYPFAPNAALASRLAQRDMNVRGSNLRKFKLRLDRRAANIGPGDAFRFRSLKRGIAEVVVRAGRIEDGTLASGVITITALQDVFGLPAAGFVPVPPSAYIPADRSPVAPSLRLLLELPYRELAGVNDPANLALLDNTAAYFCSLAARPAPLMNSYTLTSRAGSSGAFNTHETGDWCPTATLNAALTISGTTAALVQGIDLDDVRVGMAALLGSEIVRVDAFNLSTGAITLGRGCADTVPVAHAAGTRIWFYDGAEVVDETEYTQGVTVQAQLLTNTSSAQLLPANAGTDTLLLQGRQGRPYPPGNLRINGGVYPSDVAGNLNISFSHRNRLQQADQLVDTTVGDIGPEAGVTYTARLLKGSAVVDIVTGVTGTNVTLVGSETAEHTLELWSERGSVSSYQRIRHTFMLTFDTSITVLLRFNGANNSTAIIDETGRPWTAHGTAKLSTSAPLYGSASLACDGAARISTPSTSDLGFGSLPFCIELSFKLPASASIADSPTLISKRSGGTAAGRAWVEIWVNTSGRIVFGIASGAGTWGLTLTAPAVIPRDTRQRLALSRDGNTVRLFLEGVVVASGTLSSAVYMDSSELFIGSSYGTGAGANFFSGLIDEVRITRGSPVRTAAYTPESGEFPSV